MQHIIITIVTDNDHPVTQRWYTQSRQDARDAFESFENVLYDHHLKLNLR